MKIKILTLLALTATLFACERESLSPETGVEATFALQEYNPSDDVAIGLITDFKAARIDATNKQPFHDMKIDHALWLLEAAANEANANLDGANGAVTSLPMGSFSIAAERRGINYFVSGADMEAVYALVQAQIAVLGSVTPSPQILAVDLVPTNSPISSPPSPLPNSFTFQFDVTVLLDIANTAVVGPCSFLATDDWEWWNENIPGKLGNCTLNSSPNVDATMRIESKIAACLPTTGCKYYTNVVALPKNAYAEGPNPADITPNDNYFDYKLFTNRSDWTPANYHSCMNEIEMDFYRDWTVQLGINYLPPAKVLIRHDLIGHFSTIPFPSPFDYRFHDLTLYYGKCGVASPI